MQTREYGSRTLGFGSGSGVGVGSGVIICSAYKLLSGYNPPFFGTFFRLKFFVHAEDEQIIAHHNSQVFFR